jgi:NADH-quinone oxidoreductase subunit I
MRELLERLFQVDFLKGLAVTFRAQNPKNIVTEQYPLERPMVAERYRGAPRLNNYPETGETLCISCNLCALACPENLIVVGWERGDATRRKVLTFLPMTLRGACSAVFARMPARRMRWN